MFLLLLQTMLKILLKNEEAFLGFGWKSCRTTDRNGESSRFRKILHAGSVSLKRSLFFTKNLSVMLRAGTTLTDAIDVLEARQKANSSLF